MFKNKTEQNRNYEKYSQTGTIVKFQANQEGFRATAIMLRSIAANSSWRFMVIVVKKQPSLTALSFQAIFMLLWIRLSYIHKTQALSSLFSDCYVKKLAYFYELSFGRISLNISVSDSALETNFRLTIEKNFRQKW